MGYAVLIAFVLLAACTEEPSGSGGTSHVASFDVLASTAGACIDAELADVDPNMPGNQYECSVSDVRNAGQPNQIEIILPQCNNTTTPSASTNKPCWSVVPDQVNCPVAPNLIIKVERSEQPAADTRIIGQCAAV